MTEPALAVAEHVSKKFCRSLHRSLWYGLHDLTSAILPWRRGNMGRGPNDEATRPLRTEEFWALRDVSFELHRGDCLGVIGHNGAGKSTLIKLVNGLITPDTGRMTTRGRVCALIELSAGFNPILTGRENIYNQATLLGFSREETRRKFDSIVDFADTGEFLDTPLRNYSTGMAVRLGFAVAAHLEPDVLIIDEVLAVGDISFRFKCLNAIGQLLQTSAVIFVSHAMPNIVRLCNELMVLDRGHVTYHGRDLARGIGQYQALFQGAPQSVSGSGEVVVRKLSIDSGDSHADLGGTCSVSYGAELRITVTIDSVGHLEGTRIQFVLWNAEMLPVLDVLAGNLEGTYIDLTESRLMQVTAFVSQTELNGGKYTLSVIAEARDHARTYCRHDNAAYLQVDAETTSGAHSLTVADWSQQKATGS